jgi:hypothetical protein
MMCASSADAGNADRAYFCEAEATGGISLNGSKWSGVGFNVTSRFILKLTYVTSSYRDAWDMKTFDKKLESVREYKTLIRPQGSENASSCEINSVTNTIVGPDETFTCNFSDFELRFNLNTRRYLQAYFGDFLDDRKGAGSPYMQGGGCTRID